MSARTPQRRHPRPNYAGLRSFRQVRTTGTHVGVYDGHQAGMDTAGGRWSTVCEEHGAVISHLTLADATGFASHPEQWCEMCMTHKPCRWCGRLIFKDWVQEGVWVHLDGGGFDASGIVGVPEFPAEPVEEQENAQP